MNMLARLHNFCLGVLIEDQLYEDIIYKNENEDGYVEMDDVGNTNSIFMPTALMDVGHHFDEIPQSIRHYWQTSNDEMIMPREILHDIVMHAHAQHPNK